MTKDLPSPELLRKLLRYDPQTGKLFWKKRTLDIFSDSNQPAISKCNAWNARYAGKEAFTANHSHGYKHGKIYRRFYKAHRVVWAIVHKDWPKFDIDHINGNKIDNRIENLRDVTATQNAQNVGMRSNNTSGYNGVYWYARYSKWRAQINIDGNRKYLGYFVEFDEAIAARKAAELGQGYTKRHGL